MSLLLDGGSFTAAPYAEGFAALDEAYHQRPLSNEDAHRYAHVILGEFQLLQTPAEIINKGHVLTNPSQVEMASVMVDGVLVQKPFAYFRDEPKTMHLGKTKSVPYFINFDGQGLPYLTRYEEAMELLGEDPRLKYGVIRHINGKPRVGWLVSTVHAKPRVDNPTEVEFIEQVSYWGEDLGSLTEVGRGKKGIKNANYYPLARVTGDTNDSRLLKLGRPSPHITACIIPSIEYINEDTSYKEVNLTEGLYPENVHGGANNIEDVEGHFGHFVVNAHEAFVKKDDGGYKVLNYRLVDYSLFINGLELGESEILGFELKPIGVVAERKDVPDAEPKVPENNVNYYNVLYGSRGKHPIAVVGVSDRHVGIGVPIVRNLQIAA